MKIGYARVSTVDQNLDLQIDALKRAGCERIFEEKMSGKAGSNRPSLLAALNYLRPDDVLVVWKLDRLGRSLTEMMKTLDGLRTQGIHFQSLTEHFDSDTAHGRFALQIHGAMAEYFLDLNRERTLEGMKAAAARGRKGGRKKVLSSEDEDVARTLLAANTLSCEAIAKRLGVSRSTLSRYFPRARSMVVTEAKQVADLPAATALLFKRRTGPREEGAERNGGIAFHAVPKDSVEAVCGARPRRGGSWGMWTASAPTCPKCIDIIKSADQA